MKRISIVSVTVSALAVTAAFSLTSIGSAVFAQGRGTAPAYTVDPLWPQPLPNHWVFGSITGVAVDAQDHVWVVHRGADSLEANEKGMMLTPPTSSHRAGRHRPSCWRDPVSSLPAGSRC